MEYFNTIIFLVFSCLLISTAKIVLLRRKHLKTAKNQPPGPPGWPIFGNIFDLGANPHHNLYELRQVYGPVIVLKLGSVNTLVIQSAKAAAEFFKNHDNVFCDRKCPVALSAHNYNQGSLAMGRYGAYWRVLRRLCATELLVNKRVNETAHVRKECVDRMIEGIEDDVAEGTIKRGGSGEVDLARHLFFMAFNHVGRLMLSRDLLTSGCREGVEFFAAMNKGMELVGKPNLADFMPFLRRFDPQRIKRDLERELGIAIEMVAGFVKERVGNQNLKEEEKKDFLDGLLEYEGDGKEGIKKISYHNIIIIILEMFFAGSETTTSTIEWAMVELFRHPECMWRAKEELNRVIGRNRKVEEKDMEETPYLQAVVKETLRLHPPIPLLLPRNAMQDTRFMGYEIPKDTQVFVNSWANGRDPERWEDPLSFKPERFLGSKVEYKGQNFEFIPFGSGRRICVGISLAERIVPLAFASLIHYFDWELGENMTPKTIDMNERSGITVRKLIPLKAIPKKSII